jgi:hypothetical protein
MSCITKKEQQEIVGEFVCEKDLEYCMFVYLDAFVDIYRKKNPGLFTVDGYRRVWRLLELAYLGIRRDLSKEGLLTSEASSEYLFGRSPF